MRMKVMEKKIERNDIDKNVMRERMCVVYEYELDREIERDTERERVCDIYPWSIGHAPLKKGRKNNKIKRGQRNSGNQSERSKNERSRLVETPYPPLSRNIYERQLETNDATEITIDLFLFNNKGMENDEY